MQERKSGDLLVPYHPLGMAYGGIDKCVCVRVSDTQTQTFIYTVTLHTVRLSVCGLLGTSPPPINSLAISPGSYVVGVWGI